MEKETKKVEVEEVVEPKEEKKKSKKVEEELIERNSIGRRIFNIAFWIIIVGLFAIWLTDFVMVKIERDPIFCISRKVHDYDDGSVKECVGLGYKVYEYDRTSLKATEFGPFFISMRDK